MKWKPRWVIGIALLVLSFFIIIWGMRTPAYQIREIPIYTMELQPTPLEAVPVLTDNPAGRLILEWPDEIRVGDPASMRMTFLANDGEVEPAKEGSSSQTEMVRPGDPPERVLQARLELAGVQHTPTGEVSQALRLDHPVTFLWNLRPLERGAYEGKIWLHIHFYEPAGGEESQRVLAAQPVAMRAAGLFGLTGSQGRAVGSIGLVIGALLGLDGLYLNFSRAIARWSRG